MKLTEKHLQKLYSVNNLVELYEDCNTNREKAIYQVALLLNTLLHDEWYDATDESDEYYKEVAQNIAKHYNNIINI